VCHGHLAMRKTSINHSVFGHHVMSVILLSGSLPFTMIVLIVSIYHFDMNVLIVIRLLWWKIVVTRKFLESINDFLFFFTRWRQINHNKTTRNHYICSRLQRFLTTFTLWWFLGFWHFSEMKPFGAKIKVEFLERLKFIFFLML
jgi:hypothetical protein